MFVLSHKRIALFIVGLFCLMMGCGVLVFPFVRGACLFLGFDHPKEYLVLLQNNTELRASGGFMGSYARVQFARGQMHVLKIEDIYVPDGALQGHVDPPVPIQQAFGQGWFRLRDSNWDVDFPSAATTIQWFFEHGGEPKADGLIAINLTLVRELLRATGPLTLPLESTPITSDTVYARTQAAAELGFFPGSTQKRDFLSALGREVLRSWPSVPPLRKLQFVVHVFTLVRERQIFVAFANPHVVHVASALHATGALPILSSAEDFFSVSESNLGSNKANCCVKRDIDMTITTKDHQLQHVVRITFTNDNPATLKNPPVSWGGAYLMYLRVLLPRDAVLRDVKVGDLPRQMQSSDLVLLLPEQAFMAPEAARADLVTVQAYDKQGLQSVGFWVLVDAKKTQDVVLRYALPLHGQQVLRVQKQGGIDALPITIHARQTKQMDVRGEVIFPL